MRSRASSRSSVPSNIALVPIPKTMRHTCNHIDSCSSLRSASGHIRDFSGSIEAHPKQVFDVLRGREVAHQPAGGSATPRQNRTSSPVTGSVTLAFRMRSIGEPASMWQAVIVEAREHPFARVRGVPSGAGWHQFFEATFGVRLWVFQNRDPGNPSSGFTAGSRTGWRNRKTGRSLSAAP